MRAAVFFFARFAVSLSYWLILFSFGSLTFEAGSLIQILISASLIILIPVCLASEKDPPNGVFFPWFFGFILWLLIQAFGQGFGMPVFGEAVLWWKRIHYLSMFFTGFGFFFILTKILKNRNSLISFLQVYVIASTLLAFYALLFLFISATSMKIFESFQGAQAHFPLLAPLKPWIGFMMHPNNFVNLFYPGAFFSLSLVFYWNTRDPERETHQKIVSLTLLNLCFGCILMAAVLFTLSRGGIMAFFVSLFMYFFLFTLVHQRREKALKRAVILLAVLGIFLLTLGLKDILREMRTLTETLTQEAGLKGDRLMIMGACWQIIKARGLFGVGLGNLHAGWLLYHQHPFDMFPDRSMNDLLWTWAETGAPGLILFWGGLVYFVVRSALTAWRTERYSVAYLALASLSSAMALSLHALMDQVLFNHSLMWTLGTVVGIGNAALNLESKRSQGNERGSRWRMFSYGIVFLLAFMVVGYTVNRARALAMVRKNADEPTLLRASRVDPFNPSYPEDLAALYAADYERSSRPEDLEKALAALDRAIEIDPFRLLNYRRRGQLLLDSGDEAGVRQTFEIMRKRLPRFYRAELIASAFHLNSAVKSENRQLANRLETQALRHYAAALELYPQLDTIKFISENTSEAAFTRFKELREQSSRAKQQAA